MTPEKTEAIFGEFGKWFNRKNPSHSNMYWGFSHSDGWFQIEWDLCIKIRQILQDYNIPEEAYEVVQVKEKFGGLRWYHHMRNPEDKYSDLPTGQSNLYKRCFAEVDQAVNEACREASRTCEWCGQPGELREGDWLRTLCDECQKENRKGWKPWLKQEDWEPT